MRTAGPDLFDERGGLPAGFEHADELVSPADEAALVAEIEHLPFTNARYKEWTANRRVVALNTTLESGGFFSGTKRSAAVNLTLRLRPGLIIYTSTELNRVELKEGAFTTRLYRLVGETQFSPWIALVNNFQYDSVSAVLGWYDARAT